MSLSMQLQSFCDGSDKMTAGQPDGREHKAATWRMRNIFGSISHGKSVQICVCVCGVCVGAYLSECEA